MRWGGLAAHLIDILKHKFYFPGWSGEGQHIPFHYFLWIDGLLSALRGPHEIEATVVIIRLWGEISSCGGDSPTVNKSTICLLYVNFDLLLVNEGLKGKDGNQFQRPQQLLALLLFWGLISCLL